MGDYSTTLGHSWENVGSLTSLRGASSDIVGGSCGGECASLRSDSSDILDSSSGGDRLLGVLHSRAARGELTLLCVLSDRCENLSLGVGSGLHFLFLYCLLLLFSGLLRYKLFF